MYAHWLACAKCDSRQSVHASTSTTKRILTPMLSRKEAKRQAGPNTQGKWREPSVRESWRKQSPSSLDGAHAPTPVNPSLLVRYHVVRTRVHRYVVDSTDMSMCSHHDVCSICEQEGYFDETFHVFCCGRGGTGVCALRDGDERVQPCSCKL